MNPVWGWKTAAGSALFALEGVWMAAMTTGVNGLLAQAGRAAQRRAQRPSTGHVLLLMLQSDGVAGEVLAARGVREGALLQALKRVDDEPASALEIAVERAQKLATLLGEEDVQPVHLLLAVTRDTRTVAHRCLEQIGTGAAAVREQVTAILGVDESPREARGRNRSAPPASAARSAPRAVSPRPYAAVRPFTPPRPRRGPQPAPQVPQGDDTGADPASPQARGGQDELPSAGTEHAAGSASASDGPPQHDEPERTSPPRGLGHPTRRGNVRRASRRASEDPGAPAEQASFALDPDRYPTLTSLGRNLTQAAFERRLDPVFGRDDEVEQLLDVLARRRANNPVLVGPPGVGKTAVVEGLARRLAEGGEGVHGLHGRIVVELSAGSLVSGTAVRGALAERIKQLRQEVAQSEGQIILFLDEIHTIVGQGSEGPDDLASELKAALARGELPCIGATTEAEYRKHFERDAALARRFSAIHVDEPAPEDAKEVLRGIAPRYETHHAVAYQQEAIEAAVELSVRYLTERHLPDKAVGLLDLAAARVRRRGGTVVDLQAVAAVVAEQARVPVERLLMRDADRLLALEDLLSERVVGHGDVITRVADVLRKGAAGFRGSRPLGTFLLLGPTGVGKTETAKAVSEVMFGPEGMTRFDMSEMSESHAVARLLGAPPGYVGHDEGGQLTESVRRRPYQLLLLDEIEKAHPDVLLALLPLLDEGRLTDGRGRSVDFRNTIIFMTSNLGSEPRVDSSKPRIGFGAQPEQGPVDDARTLALETARRSMPPELWNRIDEPLYFAPLGRADVGEIAERMLHELGQRLEREQGVRLQIDPSVIEALIAAGGYDPELGARPMRRTIGRLVEAPLAEAVLAEGLGRGDVVRLAGDGDRVRLGHDRGPDGAADAAE
jgi:ATP-dependent Clp protease ATP-binding subunit ClpC